MSAPFMLVSWLEVHGRNFIFCGRCHKGGRPYRDHKKKISTNAHARRLRVAIE